MRKSNGLTVYDIAKAAGVSASTVSRTLDPRTRSLVNEKTAARIEKTVEELDFRINPVARSLKTRRSMTIGVLIPDLTNPLFPPIVRGLQDRLELDGYVALVASIDDDLAREQRIFDVLRDRHVDGMVLATAARGDDLVNQALDAGIPTVLINRTTDGHRVDSVVPDDRRGTAQAVEHLVDPGHRRIAHVGGPRNTTSGRLRRAAFRDALRQHGLPADAGVIREASGFTEEAGHAAATRLLDAAEPPTAIVAANDLLAFGCLSAIADRGLSCPADISVIGFNDIIFADRAAPALTTVHFSHADLGRVAAELLLRRLDDPSTEPELVVIETSLVRRKSTAPPKVG